MSRDPFAVATVALAVIFRSRLNFTDVSRKLGELVQIDGSLTCTESDARGRGDLRLAATIQIAINRVLAEPTVADRFRAEPDFAQMAVDAVYYIARRWADEPGGTIDLSRESLRKEIVSRMSIPAPAPAEKAVEPAGTAAPKADPAAAPKPAAVRAGAAKSAAPADKAGPPPASAELSTPEIIGKSDLAALHDLVLKVVGHLANFQGLALELKAEAAGDWPLADIIPPGVAGLLRAEGPGEYCYRFLLDEFGRPTGDGAPQRWTDEKRVEEAAKARAALRGIETLLDKTGLAIADFREAQVLPESVSDEQLKTLLPELEAVELTGIMTSERGTAIDSAQSFVSAVGERRKPLGEAVILVRNLARDAKCEARHALRSASRFFDTSREIVLPPDRPDLVPLDNAASPLAALADAFAGTDLLGPLPPVVDDLAIDRRWTAWRDNLIASFTPKLAGPTSYDDMLLAALGQPPGTLFRTMLAQMTVVEWSSVVLAGLPKDGEEASVAPIWALVAGLRALGFDRGLLLAITGHAELAESPGDLSAAVQVSAGAPLRPRGVVHVYQAGHPFPTVPPDLASDKPLLAIGPAEANAYNEALEWLQALGGFEGRTYEKVAGQEELRLPGEGIAGSGGQPPPAA